MAVGPGLFGHTVINWVLAHVDSSVVSVSLLGEPVGSTLLALVLLPGEVPSLPTVVGASVVLAGIAVTTTGAPAVDGDDETALENEDAAGTESSDTDGTADDPDEERTATTDD
jgi:hypothetical protein